MTNNTRIEEVWQKNINCKKEAFQNDEMKIRNLTEESTTAEDIAHIDRNANFRKNEDRSYTRNTAVESTVTNKTFICLCFSTQPGGRILEL